MNIQRNEFKGVLVLTPDVYRDDRGYFFEVFNQQKYDVLGIPAFVQQNESYSKKFTLRGMHFQKGRYAQSKLVRVVKGEILDVIVDLRRKSKTFKKVFSVTLSARNKKQLFIPKGFAHGFLVLSNDAIVSYLVDTGWNKNAERGIAWNDSALVDVWPRKRVHISDKDAHWPTLKKNVDFFLSAVLIILLNVVFVLIFVISFCFSSVDCLN